MVRSKFPIGYWNTLEISEFDESKLKDWEDAGFTMIMSPPYQLTEEDLGKVQTMLKWCRENNARIILNDPRVCLTGLKTGCGPNGAELPADYEEKVESVLADFGDCPEVFGFFLLDEPAWPMTDAAIEAVKIFRKHSDRIIPYVNFFPNFPGITHHVRFCDYGEFIESYQKRSGVNLITYDYYGQMSERSKENPEYFENLNLFSGVAHKQGIDFWNIILSTPHFAYRKPSYDDLRWQVNTSLAYGAKGILYFTFYTPKNDTNETNYRNGPINWWGERTDTFYHMRDVNRELHERWGDLFTELTLDRVGHYPEAPVKKLPVFEGGELVDRVNLGFGADPHLLVSEFRHKTTGERYAFFVNANPRDSLQLSAGFRGAKEVDRLWLGGKVYHAENICNYENYYEINLWLAPGQGELVHVK